MRDIAIDLETLGKRYDAPVLAIGACLFDRDTGKIGPTFYEEVDFKSAVKAGRPDGDTIAWWMTQSAAAQRIFDPSRKGEKRHLATALQMFGDWARGVGKGVPIVWGNGATFDISILEYAYDHGAVGLQEPWHFTNIRDMRTIVDVCLDVTGIAAGANVQRVGTHHNAKDDAVYQANVIAQAFKLLRGGKAAPKKPAALAPAKAIDTSWDDEEI
jgi:hypothetical protein